MYYYYYYNSDVHIKFTFEKKESNENKDFNEISIESLSSILNDLNLLNNCLVLSVEKEYSDYKFSPSFYLNNKKVIKNIHKLYLNKISYNSPLSLEIIIPLAASIAGIPWLILQSIEKIRNWKLNREKLKIEVEKGRLDLEEKRIKVMKEKIDLESKLLNSNSMVIWNQIIKRLESNDLICNDIEINFSILKDE